MTTMRSRMSTWIGKAKCRAASHQPLQGQQSNRSALKRVPRRGPMKRKAFPAESGARLASSSRPEPPSFLHHTIRPPGLANSSNHRLPFRSKQYTVRIYIHPGPYVTPTPSLTISKLANAPLTTTDLSPGPRFRLFPPPNPPRRHGVLNI